MRVHRVRSPVPTLWPPTAATHAAAQPRCVAPLTSRCPRCVCVGRCVCSYLRFVALLSPYSYFLFVYTGLAVVFGGLAAVFYLPNVSVWVGATVLAIMNTASYYGTEFDTWYLMSVVDDKMYGYFTVVSGIGLSLTGIIASGFMTFNISNQMVLLCSQGMAALTIIMSIFFAVAGKSRLQALGEHHGDGDADDFAKLDGGEGGSASSDADSGSSGKPRSTSRSSGRKDRAGSRGAVPP